MEPDGSNRRAKEANRGVEEEEGAVGGAEEEREHGERTVPNVVRCCGSITE